jgi:hypothetical protein
MQSGWDWHGKLQLQIAGQRGVEASRRAPDSLPQASSTVRPQSAAGDHLIEFKPRPVVLVEGNRDRSHHSGMLTSEDHRQLAERCIRLAKRKFKDVAAVTRYRHLFCAAFSPDFTLQLPESHTRTICMCSDRASLNSTSSMIDGARRASESRAAYSRCSQAGGAVPLTSTAPSPSWSLSCPLALLPKHMGRG